MSTSLWACGGASGRAETEAATGDAQAATLSRGTLLQAAWAAYPRVIRLSHQSVPARNGRLLASVVERNGDAWQVGFHASNDGGNSFVPLATLSDPAFATGLCCGTLYEMPQTVGALSAGTLLYSASVGADVADGLMDQPIYRSEDAGATFDRIEGATCGRSRNARVLGGLASGVWEPEFLVTADGSLACVFSDETLPGKSQVLEIIRTRDGLTWTAPRVIVAGSSAADRPGMAGVRKLPNGRYAMSFETCSADRLDCSAHLKLSADGLDWGDAADFGVRPATAAGEFFRHTPTLAWVPVAGSADGELALIGQIAASAAGAADPLHNGRAILVSGNLDGSGAWRFVGAPIGLPAPPVETNWCQNYSTPLLPSVDGTQMLVVETDATADGGCSARFGTGKFPA